MTREDVELFRLLLTKLYDLWDSDRDVHVGKLLIACLDKSIHYNPMASEVARKLEL